MGVVNGEGEYAVQLRKHSLTEYGVRLQQHLGVGTAAKTESPRRQIGPQVGEIVDFAIEADDVAAIRACHRLSAGRRGIDDRESRMAQSDLAGRIDKHSVVVRPSALQRQDCRNQGGAFDRGPSADSCDTAHYTRRTNSCAGISTA